jgi:hypothetical protein
VRRTDYGISGFDQPAAVATIPVMTERTVTEGSFAGRPPSQEAESGPHVRLRRRWWTAGDVALLVLVVLAIPVLSLLALIDLAADGLIATARRWT